MTRAPKHVRFARRLVALLLTASTSALPLWKCLAADEFPEMPMDVVGRVIFVKGLLNDKVPMTFIVDTGATETVITPTATERSALRATGSTDRIKKAVAKSISVGPAEVNSLAVLVFDPPQALSLRLDKGVDYSGILGQTFLARFATIIDFQRRVLRFIPIARYPRRTEKPSDAMHVVPFEFRNSLILVKADIGAARPVTFLFDTGSAETLLMPGPAKALSIPSTPLPGYVGVMQTILPRVALGRAMVSYVPTIIHAPPQDRHSSPEYEGILGHPFISNFRVIINYRDRELVLYPNHGKPEGNTAVPKPPADTAR